MSGPSLDPAHQGREDGPLRGYMVTVVGRARDDYNLTDPPELLAPDIGIQVEESAVVLRIPVAASDATTALVAARSIADDFFRVVSTSFAPYRLDPYDERDDITRTDAVYVADGPIPAGDVAEGGLSPAGWEWIDPTGEARRAGRIFRLRARGVVGHPITADARRFATRDRWPPRLRAALSLYWAGQCSPDRQVRFVLAMAALEVLAERPEATLLKARLTRSERRDLRAAVEQVLRNANLTDHDVERLLSRMLDTREVGATTVFTAYLNNLVPDGDGDLAGGVSGDEVGSWQKQRGGYLHSGSSDDSDVMTRSRDRLNLFVGVALQKELDLMVEER